MIELVFVIVILGVLAAVAVPRFVATRTDAQIATARSDMASAQKAIVAKVFADNIDASKASAPDPNKPSTTQAAYSWGTWSQWMMEVAGLDGSKWQKPASFGIPWPSNIATHNTIEPIGNSSGGVRSGCGAMLGMHYNTSTLVFAPNNLQSTSNRPSDFCAGLKRSYASSAGPGNKLIPLGSTGTLQF